MNFAESLRSVDTESSTYSGKTLGERLTGRFYTPKLIADLLATYLAPASLTAKTIKIIDPFCGDGRLIVSVINHLKGFIANCDLCITLWDCDREAISIAKENVRNALVDNGIRGSISAQCINTFNYAKNYNEAYDLCITNPPWEVLKPDRREIKFLGLADREIITNQLRKFDAILTELYPLSQPTKKFSGWGTNLARVGTELAIRLVRNNGVIGIICPATLFADQTSLPLRRWILSDVRLQKMAYFPAESKLFDRVDQPSICFSGIRGNATQEIDLSIYDAKCSLQEIGTLSAANIYKQPGLTIPFQTGLRGLEITALFDGLQRFGDLEQGHNGLWAGREIDETGYQRFLADHGEYRFVKGRMISRYELPNLPTSFIGADGPMVPDSANHERLAWRDVSRPTQKRRVQATLIPAKWAAGNSIHVAYFRDGCRKRLRQLLALMNSLAFEIQARALLSTSHVSLGVIRQIRIPNLKSTKHLSEMCNIRLEGRTDVDCALEVACAKAYGLDRDHFSLLLDLFPKISQLEKSMLLSKDYWIG